MDPRAEVDGFKNRKYILKSILILFFHIRLMKIYNNTIERVEEFKYLGTTLTNKNSIQEEIKSRLKLGMLAIIRCRIFSLPVCYPKS